MGEDERRGQGENQERTCGMEVTQRLNHLPLVAQVDCELDAKWHVALSLRLEGAPDPPSAPYMPFKTALPAAFPSLARAE